MISALEAGIRDMNKISPAALEQLKEIEDLIIKEVTPIIIVVVFFTMINHSWLKHV